MHCSIIMLRNCFSHLLPEDTSCVYFHGFRWPSSGVKQKIDEGTSLVRVNQLTPLPGWHPWNKEPNFPGWTQLTPNWHPNYKSWDGLSWHPWPPADTPLLVLGWTQLTPSWHPMYFLWKISYKPWDGLSWHPADTPQIVKYKAYTLSLVPRIDPTENQMYWKKKFLISPGMDSADTQLTPPKSWNIRLIHLV